MTRRPRVVHLTTAHDPRDPRIFHKQLQTLRDAGFDARFVAPHAQDEVRCGIPITALPQGRGYLHRLQLQRPAYHAARALRADLYHIHDPELIPVAYALKRSTGACVVYDMHENYRAAKGPLLGGALRALERWCFRWVDHVVAANAGHRRIPQASGAPETLVANYFKPPEEELPVRKPPLADGLRLVYTGVMAEERGLLSLVDLAARFRAARPCWRLDLAGVCYRKGDRRRAEAQIREQGAAPALRRTGWDEYVPWPVLAEACAAAHVGLVLWMPTPHNRERLPTKFYEYLHYGLPILCSDLPLWRAFVEEHGCGAVVPPADAEAAFCILQRWADDPAAYEKLAAAARRAAPAYRWEEMGRRLVRLYEELLS